MNYDDEKTEYIANTIVRLLGIFLGIIFVCYLLFGCSKEDDQCKCTAKYNNWGQSGYYYIDNTPIDCETRRPLKAPSNPNSVFVGCE